MAGSGVIGRVSRPISGESVPADASATVCGNGVQMPEGVRRPDAENEVGNSRLTPQKDAGDIPGASRNHHRPRRPSFVLPCRFCDQPVKLGSHRFAELFDADRLPVCGECRRYQSYISEIRG